VFNVLEYIEATVEKVPDKAAFCGENEVLTFSELHDAARGVGSYLAAQGIYKQPIAIFMEKSPSMIAAFLGVANAGCYYVPLDAEIPAFRIKLILETVRPAMIICDENTRDLLEKWEIGCEQSLAQNESELFPPHERNTSIVLFSEAAACRVDDVALMAIREKAIDADPLYIVFTSGSTGTPKGVIATHRSVIDYVENLSKILQVDEDTVFGLQSPLYLDACLKEVCNTLKFGATTFFVPKSLFMFPVKLIEYLNENKVNTICWVASALGLVAGLGALDAVAPAYLRTVAFGSEVFPIKHFNKWREVLPNARFVHLYGPTEATGMSAYYVADRVFEEDEPIPIGRAFPNTEIILLTDDGQVPPLGQAGEICIRGVGLSPGYFADEEKTRAVFVQNPLSATPDIVYKTGDLGFRGENGLLYFISRRDHQIKHMGHRIELAEIEYVANRCEDVELACAVFEAVKGKIVLYFIGSADKKSAVLAYLKENLPRYMVPHAVFPREALPLTAGGKINRGLLLEEYNKK